jgi:anti-anti-sigma factor
LGLRQAGPPRDRASRDIDIACGELQCLVLACASVEIEMSKGKLKFAIEERPSADNHGLVLRGALRPADASQLQSAVARICEGRRTRVVLDLRELASIDSAGMHCLIAAYDAIRERGHELEVPPGSQIEDVHQLIEVLAGLPLLVAEGGRPSGVS